MLFFKWFFIAFAVLFILFCGLGTWVLFVLDQTGVVVITGDPTIALVLSTAFSIMFIGLAWMLEDV